MSYLNVAVGANAVFPVTVTDGGAPLDLTGAEVYFTLRASLAGEVLIGKANLAGGGSDSEILILLPETDGLLEVYLVPADTDTLEPGYYVYDVWIVLADDTEHQVVEATTLVLLPRVRPVTP